MPKNLDDELEEIRRLISDTVNEPESGSVSSAPQRPRQVVSPSSGRRESPNMGADFRAPVNRNPRPVTDGLQPKTPHPPQAPDSTQPPNARHAPLNNSGQIQSAHTHQSPYKNKSLSPKTPQNADSAIVSRQVIKPSQQRNPQPAEQNSVIVPPVGRGARPPSRASKSTALVNKNTGAIAPPSLTSVSANKNKVREYDISSTGNISASKEIKEVNSLDIKKDEKLSKSTTRPSSNDAEFDVGDESFKINFDFEGEYKDVPEEKPIRLRREKRTGCIGGIMYATFIICISLVLASVLWMFTVDVLGFGAVDEQVSVEVYPWFEMSDITDALYEAGIIRYRFLFNMYAGFSNAEERIIPGVFVLNQNFDYRAIVQGMTARAGIREEVTVTIPEGLTLLQIFTLMEDHGVVLSADDLWEAATYHDFDFHFLDEDTLGERFRLEGFLFPNTYNFFRSSSPTSVLNRLLREFDRRFTEEYVERAEEMGLSVHDIMNIAAMVEREAANDEERPRIAAVIYNRLASPQFPNLEIDATLSYAVQGTDQIATTALDHPFNTYTNPGLPPWPIANPGIASIRAALFPLEDTNEYFYALHVDGTHRFFRTYPEHRAFVQSDDFGRWW